MNIETFNMLLEQYGQLAIVLLFAIVAIPYYITVLKKSKGVSMNTNQALKATIYGKPILLGIIMLIVAFGLIFALNQFLAGATYYGE